MNQEMLGRIKVYIDVMMKSLSYASLPKKAGLADKVIFNKINTFLMNVF
jgi:hypothetical protein